MKRRLFACIVAAFAALGTLGTAAAHPLGNFTVNQYSCVEAGAGAVRIHYVLDMAEIPAFQERQAIDTDGDGLVSDAESQRYLERRAPALAAGLQLMVDGKPAPLTIVDQSLSFPTGQGGLVTMRAVLNLQSALPSAGQHTIEYRVTNYDERLGWREIVVRGSDAQLSGSTAPATDSTAELTRYPEDMLSSPLDVREARFDLLPALTNAARPAEQTAAQVPGAGPAADALAGLVATGELTPHTMAAALLLALALGAGHALAPGHGKTIVAAYLVGTRGTARHAVILGLVTTLTHTAGVFLLGLATLLLSRYVLPERIYPWLELFSGALVVALGLGLLRSRLAGLLRKREAHADKQAAHSHSGAMFDHEHGPHTHTHDHDGAVADWVAGGLAKSTGGDQGGARRVTWRNLVALGVSGGLLPCPSALVVLLGAIALGRVGFGMLLIVAFSIGLAAVLTGIGLLLVYARWLFDRVQTGNLLLRALPVASAAVVVVAGLAITAGALGQVL